MVGGLHAGKQHIRRLALGHRRQNARDGNGIGVFNGACPPAHRAIRSLRQALAQRLIDLLGAHRDRDYFHRFSGGLFDLDGLLQGEVVPFVQIADEKLRVDIAPVVADLEILVERRDLLDRHQNLHAGSASARRAGTASRMSSKSSLTTNLPSLPVVLSASSNIVRSFGQLTTYISSPGIAAASFIRFCAGFSEPTGSGIQILPPPAPQQKELALQRPISTSSPPSSAHNSRGAS